MKKTLLFQALAVVALGTFALRPAEAEAATSAGQCGVYSGGPECADALSWYDDECQVYCGATTYAGACVEGFYVCYYQS